MSSSSSSSSSSIIQDIVSTPPVGKKSVLLFWAPWHEASVAGGPMDQVLHALAAASSTSNSSSNNQSDDVFFGRVEAEQAPSVCEQYGVTVVPTFVLLNAQGQVFQRLEGTDDTIAQVTQAVQRLAAAPTTPSSTTKSSSSATTNTVTVEPTAKKDNSSSSSTTTTADESSLSKRLEALIRSSEVMLFMKGTPTAPKCGFSRKVVELLQAEDIPFGSFNILADEEIRQGLKTHSDWPTYPQIYVRGELMGGLDILQEMKEQGCLVEQLGVKPLNSSMSSTTATSATPLTLEQRLAQLVKRHHIMLFMKGLPSAPKCGFSRQLVELLNDQGVAYDAFDILQDEEVRQGLKTLSNWPTFPQLYVNGELIGGLDICQEMAESGELQQVLLQG